MHKFRKYIETIASISDEDWFTFSSRLTKREFSKKSSFLSKGEIENSISFIEKGEVRLFIPKEDEEKEDGLVKENFMGMAQETFMELEKVFCCQKFVLGSF